MLGLNLHRPPFVVIAVTWGDFLGYSKQMVSILSQVNISREGNVPLLNLNANY
jgi:hypothetical protein